MDLQLSQIRVRFQPSAPTYPRIAKVSRIQGTVKVLLTVGLDGNPTKCDVLDGPPALRDAAVEFAMRWRFDPYVLDGEPRTVRIQLHIPFSLH